MSEEVGIRYVAEGTEEAARGVGAFADANERLSQSADQADEATTRVGRSFSEMANQANQTAGRVQQFNAHARDLLGGVQLLAGALGAQEGGAASRMLEFGQSLLSASEQGAAAGAVFGPQGALVGGIVGAAIPAVQELIAALQPVPEVQGHVAIATDAASEAFFAQATAAEHATQSIQDLVNSLSLGGLREHATDIADQITHISDAIEQLESGRAAEFFGGDTVRAERFRFTEQLTALQEEFDRTQEMIREGTASTRRGGGGGRGSRRDDSSGFDEAVGFARGLTTDADASASARGNGLSSRGGRDEAGGLSAQMSAERQLRTLEQQRLTARIALEDKAHDERMRQQQEYLASIQDELAVLNNAGETLGAVFSNAFQAAISGQEDFGEAMEQGIKRVLLQYGTQMVAEGVGALLTGVGNIIFNPPAAAAKLAEGAGKIALGVGLGAAGAAMPAAASGGAGARPAEGPRGPAANEHPGGVAPVTIVMNAPVIMGGTHAEVARTFSEQGMVAARRYNRRAA